MSIQNSHIQMTRGSHIKAMRHASYDTDSSELPSTNYLGETFFDQASNTLMINTTGSAGAANWDHLIRGGMDVTIDGNYTFDRGSGVAPFTIAQSNAATVGNLDSDKIDGFHASQSVTANTAAVRGAGGRLKVGDPSASDDAATKNYVDLISQGLGSIKEPCRYVVATNTTNVTSSAPSTIDGETPSTDDRILVAKQSTGSQNGIWLYKGSGNPMVRAQDADQDGELKPGSMVFVTDGSTYADSSWAISDVDSGTITPGTTAHEWSLIDRLGEVTVGDGLSKTAQEISANVDGSTLTATGGTGDQLAIDSSYAGQTSITTLGTITTGTWNGTTIDAANGGTGQTTYAQGDLLVGNGSNGLDKLAKGTEGYILKSGASTAEWYDKVKFLTSTVEPVTTNAIDLGTDSKRFKDGYFEGDIDIDGTLDVEGEISAPTIQSQRVGRQGGFSFDGVDDGVTAAYDLSGGQAYTFHIDLKLDALTSTQTLFADYGSSGDRSFRIAVNSSGDVEMISADGNTSNYHLHTTGPTITAGTRHNIVLVRTSSSSVTIYVDGKTQDVSTSTVGSGGSDVLVSASENLSIGLRQDSANPAGGDIYDVRIWSSTKTAAEALAISQGYNDTANLELHLSETSTTDWGWLDLSGNQRHAVNNGATRIESPINKNFVSEENYISYRKLDGGYRFDGADDLIQTGYNAGGNTSFSGVVTFVADDLTSNGALLGEYDTATNNRAISFEVTSSGELKLTATSNGVYSSGGQVWTSGAFISIGTRYTVGFTLDGDVAQFYVDGAAIASPSTTDNGYTGTIFTSNEPGIAIGATSQPATYFEGEIYEARIFNHALDDATIKEYSRGAATKWVDRIDTTHQVPAGGKVLEDATITGLTIGDDSISGTNSSGGTAFIDFEDLAGLNENWKKYSKYRLTFDYTGSTTAKFKDDETGGTSSIDIDGSTGSGSFEITKTNDSKLYIRIGNGDSCNIENIVLTPLGEVAHYTPQSAQSNLWEDVSGLEHHAAVDGAELLASELHETFVDEQDFISSRVGQEAGYYFESGNNIESSAISGQGDFSFSWEADFEDFSGSGTFFILGPSSVNFRLQYSGSDAVYYLNNTNLGTQSDYLISGKHSYAVTSNRDGDAIFYRDGKKVGAIDISSQSSYLMTGLGVSLLGMDGTTFHGVQVYNRALTPAEVAKVSRGQKLGFEDYGADGTGYSSDYSAGVDGWGASRGTLAGNIDAVGGENDWARLTLNTQNNAHYVSKTGQFTVGKRYRVSGKLYHASGNDASDGIRVSCGGVQTISAHDNIIDDTIITFSEEFIANDTSLLIVARNGASDTVNDTGGDDVIYFKSIEITQLGLTLDLNSCNIGPNVWRDNSGNNYTGTVTGATPINHRQNFYTKNIYISQNIYDALNDTGTTNQVLTRTANGVEWADAGVGGGFVTGTGVGKQLTMWSGTGASSALEEVEIYADTANDYFGFGSSVTSPSERIQTDGNISLTTLGANVELPEEGALTYNAYYDAAFKARANGHAAIIEQESDGDLSLKVTASSATAGFAPGWTERIKIQAATNQVDFSGDITADDITASGDVTVSSGDLIINQKISTNNDSIKLYVDEDNNSATKQNRALSLYYGTTERFRFGFDGVDEGHTQHKQIASVGPGNSNIAFAYLDNDMTGTWGSNADKQQIYVAATGYSGVIDNTYNTWDSSITHVKGSSWTWNPLRATSTDNGSSFSNWSAAPSFGYDIEYDAWVINGDVILGGQVFNTTTPGARVFSTTVTTHANEGAEDYHLINHALGTERVIVQVFEWNSGVRGPQVGCDVWSSNDTTNISDANERNSDTSNYVTVGILGDTTTQDHLIMVLA